MGRNRKRNKKECKRQESLDFSMFWEASLIVHESLVLLYRYIISYPRALALLVAEREERKEKEKRWKDGKKERGI